MRFWKEIWHTHCRVDREENEEVQGGDQRVCAFIVKTIQGINSEEVSTLHVFKDRQFGTFNRTDLLVPNAIRVWWVIYFYLFKCLPQDNVFFLDSMLSILDYWEFHLYAQSTGIQGHNWEKKRHFIVRSYSNMGVVHNKLFNFRMLYYF